MKSFFAIFILIGTIVSALADTPLTPVQVPAILPLYYNGVNFDGYEYNPGLGGATYGSQYILSSVSDVDYFQSKRFSVIRILFDIGRAQPTNNATLDAANIGRLTTLIEEARRVGMYVILDAHNFGNMWCTFTTGYIALGTATTCNGVSLSTLFNDFWTRMAQVYQNYPNVMYELMNEPAVAGVTAAQWKTVATSAAAAIRTVTTTQRIIYQGIDYDGAMSWTTTSGNAAAWAGFTDNSGPWWMSVHQYFDTTNSGSNPDDCVPRSETRLDAVSAWATANNIPLFLGEFGIGNNNGNMTQVCIDLLNSVMTRINKLPFIGWTWFDSGPWISPGSDNIGPNTAVVGDQPQMRYLNCTCNCSAGH